MALQPTLMPRAPALWERQDNGNGDNGNGNGGDNGQGNGNGGNGNGNGNGGNGNGGSPFDSIISQIFGGPSNTDSIISSASSTSTPSTTSSTRRTTSSSSSTRLPSPIASTPTTSFTPTSTTPTSTSSTISSTTSSTPTTTSSSSSSSTVITTSSPSTLVSTSQFVSGTSTSQVVVTTVVTPVVTTTSSPDRANLNRSSVNGGLIGGVVGGVVGGLALLALLIAICVMSTRRRSRTGHAYFLCFGERPSRNKGGDLGHSGGAWPTFDPQNDHAPLSYAAAGAGAGAAAGGVGAAAVGSRSRRHRRDQTNATLPADFANDDDPERYGYNGSSAVQSNSYQNYEGYDAYNAYGGNGYNDMQERPSRNGASALAAGAAAGGAGAYLYNHASPSNNRRSSSGHPAYSNSHEGYNSANMSPHATTSTETAPAPWTLPMMGWQDTHGPYSVAGVGHNMGGPGPQAQFMVSPSEANAAAATRQSPPGQTRSPGPDYSHFDPPEVRDARAREAAAAALGRGSFSSNSHMPTSPRRQSRRLSSNHGSPINDNIGLLGGPPAYVDAQDALEEVDEQPRRLHLTNAEPDLTTDDDSSRAGGRRPAHNHKDAPPTSTYRRN